MWNTLDWLYPPVCSGCGAAGVRWCRNCQTSIVPLIENICERCGDLWFGGGICDRCSISSPFFSAIRSCGIYDGPLRNAIHKFKYMQDLGIADILSKYLIMNFNIQNWSIDLVIPVPISRRRFQERGYNQTSLLARPLSLGINLPYLNNALTKVKETKPQVGLNVNERATNVQDAFLSDPKVVKGKDILLIDDVTTTGSTINSCSESLLSAGANSVYGLTVARAALQAGT